MKKIISLFMLLSLGSVFANKIHQAVHDLTQLIEVLESYSGKEDELKKDLADEGEFYMTPLELAVDFCVYDSVMQVVPLLLEKGAIGGNHPIVMWALEKHENKQLAELLIKAKQSINMANVRSGDTPLIWAVKNDDLELVELLLKKGADIGISNESDKIAFSLAVDNKTMIKLLLKYAGRIEKLCFMAVKDIKMMRILLENGGDANLFDEDGATLLSIAAMRNDLEMVKLLLKKGASKSINECRGGYFPLYWAAFNKNIKMINILYYYGARLHDSLYRHISNSRLDELDSQFKSYIDNLRGYPTEYCTKEDLNELSFMSTGAPYENPIYDTIDKDDADLLEAVLLSYEDKAQLIIDINVMYNSMYELYHAHKYANITPLLLAVRKNNLTMVELLLENGAIKTINVGPAGYDYGDTPLCCAIWKDNIEMVKLLLKNGADKCINDTDISGYAPLYGAEKKGNPEMIGLLKEYGATTVSEKKESCSIQ